VERPEEVAQNAARRFVPEICRNPELGLDRIGLLLHARKTEGYAGEGPMERSIRLDRGRSFAQIVYQVVVVEKVVPLDQAAASLGMGYDALYARINGRTLLPRTRSRL
jgi:hypothetical protein